MRKNQSARSNTKQRSSQGDCMLRAIFVLPVAPATTVGQGPRMTTWKAREVDLPWSNKNNLL